MKRTDVGGARYDYISAKPEDTVARFTRRWVAGDKRLGIDPSLVTLRLVKAGPGVPTDAEDAAALSEDRLLRDPSVTLRAAGVTNGCWLLAVFANGARCVASVQRMFSPACARCAHAGHGEVDASLASLHVSIEESPSSFCDGKLCGKYQSRRDGPAFLCLVATRTSSCSASTACFGNPLSASRARCTASTAALRLRWSWSARYCG